MTRSPAISFEFFPPPPGAPEERFWQTAERLNALGPDFCSVTYGAGGTTKDRTFEIVTGLNARGIDTAAHLTLVGASRSEVDAVAQRLADAGVRRFVALRGDMPNMAGGFEAHPEGYANSVELIERLRRLGDFDISVGAYPEAHPSAASAEADVAYLKRKLDAGAARAVTQYFFDPEVFLRFRDRAAAAGIDKPLVAGVLPVTNFAKLLEFSAKCGASVPAWLHERFADLDDDPETRALVAAHTAAELCQRLMSEGVEEFHFYTLNRANLSYAVCRLLGIRPALEEAA
jgi:methylenetetrahydrofolate reductase (NADPH)